MAGNAAAPADQVNESTPESEEPTPAEQPEPAEVADTEDETAEAAEAVEEAAPAKQRMSKVRLAMIVGLAMVVALAALGGWLGYRFYNSYQAEQQRRLFLEVGRQGALNLTTIDWQHADADVQRILDSATGTFYDDFQRRAQPFIAVVKQAQSHSVGTITEAGLESVSGDQAQVLVAVTVKTSTAGAEEQKPRYWRMRITVQKMDDQAKVSNVEFVP